MLASGSALTALTQMTARKNSAADGSAADVRQGRGVMESNANAAAVFVVFVQPALPLPSGKRVA